MAREEVPRMLLRRLLVPELPKLWHIVPSQRNVDNVNATVVQLKQLAIRRNTVAPSGGHILEFVVTISAPQATTQAAEDRLDDEVNTLLHAIDVLQLPWSEERKVNVGTNAERLGYDITGVLLKSTTTKG